MGVFRTLIKAAVFVAVLAFARYASMDKAFASDMVSIDRGRYVVKIASCNNCHTPGYIPMAGKVEERLWLTGSPVGYRGEWGTTYAANLRLYMERLSEDQWVTTARTIMTRPPMAWFVLQNMSDHDLRSIYRYIRYLGPAGETAPAFLPPGQEPNNPYIVFPRQWSDSVQHAMTRD
ncbi:MAG: hypothetical protein WC048_18725 [Rhizobium sp.]|jgi:mono/diheme cytochrome c family protein